ncbi:OsmC family protein [Aliiroseovarius sp. M344]|uniref:OsmC family protein n=1 Tax=Aliiroseovarius sp. M344 TaxID=2867010 RepID=UPI0021AD73FF|nr:OsmC family protein [Aliiroseovarius sp. M344]UWQ14808.1 OsmC family protein [Aliiroseovarius sp. M344]
MTHLSILAEQWLSEDGNGKMKVDVQLRNLPGTEAAVGWAGSHTIVADRPEGKAGGLGLGFNGAQLLALALGGCFCNDLRYAAEELGVKLDNISVDVSLELGGEPLVVTTAHMLVDCTTLDSSDPTLVVESARSSCVVSNSLSVGVPVSISMAG